MEKNLYKILNISKNATAEQIKAAYIAIRKNASVNPTGKELAHVQEAGHAWDILGDPKKRAEYDLNCRLEVERIEIKGPRWGGVRKDLNDTMDYLFESSFGFSWETFATGRQQAKKGELYISKADFALLSVLVDSYKNPREDGKWIIKAANVHAGKTIDIGDEVSVINKHSLGLWNKGDKRINSWKLNDFYSNNRI